MRFTLSVILLVSYQSFDSSVAAQEGLRSSASLVSDSADGGEATAADGLAAVQALAKFASWADEHGKAYHSEEERSERLLVWMENDGAS
jgi:hypothetical protein